MGSICRRSTSWSPGTTLEKDKLRLEVDVKDLADYDSSLHRQVLTEPSECMQPFEDALDELVRNAHPKKLAEGQEVHVGFTGVFGWHRLSPRELTSDFISKLINVEGIVTKCSLGRPKLVKSVHFCEATSQFISREYRDVTSNAGPAHGSSLPHQGRGRQPAHHRVRPVQVQEPPGAACIAHDGRDPGRWCQALLSVAGIWLVKLHKCIQGGLVWFELGMDAVWLAAPAQLTIHGLLAALLPAVDVD